MLKYSRLLFTALAATVVMGALVGSASANHLSVNELGMRITWTELNLTETIFGIGVHCPVTLEGAFSRATIEKVIGSQIGSITRAIVANERCRGGHATVLTETLPWRVTYEGFGGTLPRITSVILLLAEPAFRIETAIITCLSRATNLRGTVTGTNEARGALTAETLTPGRETIPCREAGGGSINGVFSGPGNITKAGRTEHPVVSLI